MNPSPSSSTPSPDPGPTYDEAMAELMDIWNRYGWPSDADVAEAQRLVRLQTTEATP